MKALFDNFPLAVFLIALILKDLKTATAAIIVACVIQVAWSWFRHGRVEKMHLITMLVVLILGGVTLLLNDVRYIKWKPTAVNWVFAILMIGTQLLTQKTALERVMGGKLSMPKHAWNRLNMSWALFFAFLGALNLYVAFLWATPADPLGGVFDVVEDAELRDKYWGYFKVFGVLGLTFLFAIISMTAVSKHISIEEDSDEDDTDTNKEKP